MRIKAHPTASKTFNGRKAAEDWARLTEDAIRGGTMPPQESMTLSALIDRYVKEIGKFQPMSATKRGNLRRWEESLGDREVTTLTGQDILSHIGQRKAGPATMTMELGFLGEVLAAGRSGT
ncbi:hypothetical protein [Xanthomonas arboricola]|uniref:hypothetical protein n=1 Tax=Xanthomonas arboricola TaxID=56448 RepID=UPI000CEEF483|nr:hypothetical protein [Xanthomonas arboricola]PPU19301.1 hypothetical protein XarbCFBP7610_11580 [Xanthomonas arboricola]